MSRFTVEGDCGDCNNDGLRCAARSTGKHQREKRGEELYPNGNCYWLTQAFSSAYSGRHLVEDRKVVGRWGRSALVGAPSEFLTFQSSQQARNVTCKVNRPPRVRAIHYLQRHRGDLRGLEAHDI